MTKKKKPSPQKILRQILLVLMTIFAAVAAVIFLLPTVLTITNSFMSQTEINANYGVVFNSVTDSKTFISKTVNLKFIPDIVSFSQYFSVLFKTPDYLLKFWNSAILTVPIVIFQTVVALFASYGFSRLTGKLILCLYHTYAHALSGNAGSKLSCVRKAGHSRYQMGDNPPRNFLALCGVPANKGNEAYPKDIF